MSSTRSTLPATDIAGVIDALVDSLHREQDVLLCLIAEVDNLMLALCDECPHAFETHQQAADEAVWQLEALRPYRHIYAQRLSRTLGPTSDRRTAGAVDHGLEAFPEHKPRARELHLLCEGIREHRMREYRKRIQSGYYRQPHVLNDVACKVVDEWQKSSSLSGPARLTSI